MWWFLLLLLPVLGQNASETTSYAYGDGTRLAIVNQTANFWIQACNNSSVNLTTGGASFSALVYTFDKVYTEVRILDLANGLYHASYIIFQPGTFQLIIFLNNRKIQSFQILANVSYKSTDTSDVSLLPATQTKLGWTVVVSVVSACATLLLIGLVLFLWGAIRERLSKFEETDETDYNPQIQEQRWDLHDYDLIKPVDDRSKSKKQKSLATEGRRITSKQHPYHSSSYGSTELQHHNNRGLEYQAPAPTKTTKQPRATKSTAKPKPKETVPKKEPVQAIPEEHSVNSSRSSNSPPPPPPPQGLQDDDFELPTPADDLKDFGDEPELPPPPEADDEGIQDHLVHAPSSSSQEYVPSPSVSTTSLKETPKEGPPPPPVVKEGQTSNHSPSLSTSSIQGSFFRDGPPPPPTSKESTTQSTFREPLSLNRDSPTPRMTREGMFSMRTPLGVKPSSDSPRLRPLTPSIPPELNSLKPSLKTTSTGPPPASPAPPLPSQGPTSRPKSPFLSTNFPPSSRVHALPPTPSLSIRSEPPSNKWKNDSFYDDPDIQPVTERRASVYEQKQPPYLQQLRVSISSKQPSSRPPLPPPPTQDGISSDDEEDPLPPPPPSDKP